MNEHRALDVHVGPRPWPRPIFSKDDADADGWSSRGYLPHWDRRDVPQSVTFRLADAVPARVVQMWREELRLQGHERAGDQRTRVLLERIEAYADAGYGECALRRPGIAQLVEETLLHFHGDRYTLLAWCIMPNHVHVLVHLAPTADLGRVVRTWKVYVARRANRLLDRTGRFWQREYFDRAVRNPAHLRAVWEYIEHNPVRAGLVARPADWPHSSAGRGWPAPAEPP